MIETYASKAAKPNKSAKEEGLEQNHAAFSEASQITIDQYYGNNKFNVLAEVQKEKSIQDFFRVR